MRKFIFYGTVLFFCVSVQARILRCDLAYLGEDSPIKALDISLDDKPTGVETVKAVSADYVDNNYVINGVKGSLTFHLGAHWYNDFSTGKVRVNNMNDTFPRMFFMATFHKRLSDGTFDGDAKFIEIFYAGVPTINFTAESRDSLYYIFEISKQDVSYYMACKVIH